MNEREADLVAHRLIRPHLGNRDAHIGAEPPRGLDGRHGQIEMKRDAQRGERLPLRHRLEVVHRLRTLHLDDAGELAVLVGRLQHQVGVPRRLGAANRGRLLGARIDGDLELSLVFRLQQANDPIVLELLADGPHEDWAQVHLRGEYIRVRAGTGNVRQAPRI